MVRPTGQGLVAGARAILGLGVPLIGFFMIQNVVGLATLAMLGRLGDATLAGVGAAGVVYGVALALLFGFDTGVQALASRTTGAGAESRLGQVLADSLGASIPVGALLAAAAWFLGPPLVGRMLGDRAAVAAGAALLARAAPSLLFFAAVIPLNACWIGSGRPTVSFLVTLLTAPLQIGLTAILVFGVGPVPALGAGGAGLALTVTTLASLAVQIAVAVRLAPVPGLWRARPRAAGMARVAAIGWPVSAQQSLLQLGLMIAFVIVARLGTAQAAMINVLANLTLVPIQCATGLGVAAATLVGQSLGRADVDAARRWGWRTAQLGALLLAPLGLAAALAPRHALGLFLTGGPTLAMAVWPARILGLGVCIDSFGRVLGFAFRGAGATRIAAGAPFITLWFFQLPLMWWVGLRLGQGVEGMVLVQVGLAVVDAGVLAWIWRGGSWTGARIGAEAASKGAPPSVALGSLKRIAVLGGAGAGKSTLARRLGETLGLPVTHLDRIVYGPGWARLDIARARERLGGVVVAEAWVIEGTYADLADLVLPRADLVIWLEQPAWLRLYRSWRKTRIHRRRARPDRPDGCAEEFGWSYIVTILSFGRWSSAIGRRISQAGPGRPVLRLAGDGAVARFLAGPAVEPSGYSAALIASAASCAAATTAGETSPMM